MLIKPGLLSAEDVIINDIPLNTIDDNSVAWIVTDIDGWWGLPDVEVPDDVRPYSQDGSYYTTGRFTARTINLKGYILPTDGVSNKAVASRNAFNRALVLVRQRAQLKVREEGIVKVSLVQISARPMLRISQATGLLEFDIQLKATDPLKYGEFPHYYEIGPDSETPGRMYSRSFNYNYGGIGSSNIIDVYNNGSYASYPRFTVLGPINNPVIEHMQTGHFLRLDTEVDMDTPLYAWSDTRQILMGEENHRSALRPTSRWFPLQPGKNTIRFSGETTDEARDAISPQMNTAHNPVPLEPGANKVLGSFIRTNLAPNPRPFNFFNWSWSAPLGELTSFEWVDEPGPNQYRWFMRRTVTQVRQEGTGLVGGYRVSTGGIPYAGISGEQFALSAYVRVSHPQRMGMWGQARVGSSTQISSGSTEYDVEPGKWTRLSTLLTTTGSFDNIWWHIYMKDSPVLPVGGTVEFANLLIEKTTELRAYIDDYDSYGITPRNAQAVFTGSDNQSSTVITPVDRGWTPLPYGSGDPSSFYTFTNPIVTRRAGTSSVEIRRNQHDPALEKHLASVTNIGGSSPSAANIPFAYPGQINGASMHVLTQVPDIYAVCTLQYYNSAGSLVRNITLDPVPLRSFVWDRLIVKDTAVAPASSAYLKFSTSIYTNTDDLLNVSTSVFVQDAKIGLASFIEEPYFDGDMEFADWLATPHDSPSTVTTFVPAINPPKLIIEAKDTWIE